MKRFLTVLGIALISAFIPATMSAQSGYQVKGTVVDAMGPVIGAAVMEQGTTTGTMTDLDGNFVLTVSGPDAVIEVSCMSYATQTFVARQLPATITLVEDSEFLEDIVVIGYGTVKKEDMTGSVTAIKSEEINRGALVSTQDLLKGKVAGLQVIPGSGQPGAGSTIRIRGAASLNASNDPLVVVDGVPLANDGGEGMTNPLESINPNDIESFTVLKDASAAAIYGSRASNGVIIITTKKGSGSGIKVSYNGNFSLAQNTKTLDVMDADEYRAFIDATFPVGTSTGDIAHSRLGNANTDWNDLIFRTAFSQEHNVSVYGMLGKKVPFRLSEGFSRQQGTLKNSEYNKGNIDLSLSPKFFDDHLTVNVNGKLVATDEDKANSGAVGTAAFFNPTIDPYFRNADGSIDYTTTNGYFNYGSGRGTSFSPNNLAGSNPLSLLYDYRDLARAFRFIGNTQFDYKVHGFEALRLNLNLGYDVSRSHGYVGELPGSFNAYKDTENPIIGQYDNWSHKRTNTVLEFYADYNKDFGKSNLDVMAGYSWQHFYGNDRDVYYFNVTNQMKLDPGQTIDSRYPLYEQENYLVSFYGRLNYSYASRYLFTFTLRDDGSSRFAKAHRWGLFPSAAFAWNVKEEGFLKGSRAISTLKFRLSWGKTGQQDGIRNYYYQPIYTVSTDQYHAYNMGGGSTTYLKTVSPAAYNPELRWETTTTYNAGLDFGFANNRISGTADVYKRVTDDLLNELLTPMGANFGNSLLYNIGSMENKGVELTLNLIPIETKDMSLVIGLNGTLQSTKFTKLNNTDDPNYAIQVGHISGGTGNYIGRHMVGYAPYSFYAYQQLYDAGGKPIQNAFVDRNKNNIIDTGDMYMTGKSPNPDFFGGVNLKFNYRNWDFGFNGHGSVGNWVFNNVKGENSSANIVISNIWLNNYLRYAKESGFVGTNSIVQYSSDLFLEDASFFRMDDINLGYTFRNLFRKEGTDMRIGFTVQNAFVLTGYSGIDPEIPGSEGIDSSIWPRPRTYSLRVNLNF